MRCEKLLLDSRRAGLWPSGAFVVWGWRLRCTARRFGDQRFLIRGVILRRSKNELETFSCPRPWAEHWRVGSLRFLCSWWRRWLLRVYLGGSPNSLIVWCSGLKSTWGTAGLRLVILSLCWGREKCRQESFTWMRRLSIMKVSLGSHRDRQSFLIFHRHCYFRGIIRPQ